MARTPFITSFPADGTLRNDTTIELGVKFTPTVNIQVVSLGRWIVSGNSGTHLLRIWEFGVGFGIDGGGLTVNTVGGTPGTFKYVDFASPITLLAGHDYSVNSTELASGDQWYDDDGSAFSYDSGIATPVGSVYQNQNLHLSGAKTYVAVNFEIDVSAPGTDITKSDDYTLSDSLALNVGIQEELSDSISLSDSATVELAVVLEETASDSISLTDSIAFALLGVNEVSVDDAFVITSSVLIGIDYALQFSDTITLSDSASFLNAIVAVFSDSLTLSDSIVFAGLILKIFSDRLILTDLMLLDAPAANESSDTIVLSDSTKIVLSIELVISDSLGLSDSITVVATAVLTITVSDSISLSDSISKLLSTSNTNYLRNYLNDVQGIRTPESISTPADEDPGELNEYLRRYLNDIT